MGVHLKSTKLFMVLSTIATFSFLFQNCQETSGDNFSKNSVGKNSNTTELSSSSSSQAQVSSSSFPSNPVANSEVSNTLKVSYLANGSTSTDCSKSDSVLNLEVTNAGSDILVCPEYDLDMPANHPRKGESFRCSSNNFVVPPSTWTYDSGNRKWTASEVVSNSAYLVPGSFYVVVKDNQGKIYKSAAAVIKRTGYANCQTSSAVYKRCAWSGGIVIGPTPNYAITTNQSCQYGTERYQHVDASGNVYNYQCNCQ